jgi:hypothetical protein
VLSHDIRSRDLKLVNANAPTVRANGFAFMLIIITVFCFIALKYIILPNSLMAYLLKLYLVFLLFAKATLLYVNKT